MAVVREEGNGNYMEVKEFARKIAPKPLCELFFPSFSGGGMSWNLFRALTVGQVLSSQDFDTANP